MPSTKSQTIYDWKRYGLIYDDYDDLYEIYIKTMKCDNCNKEFKNSRDRCMDHDHKTGKFRKIVCQTCNKNDNYIKYPNGFTIEDLRKNRREWSKKKTTCICGSIVNRGYIYEHKKSQKHLNNMDKYMNNVD